MTAKEYLENYRRAQARADKLREKYDSLAEAYGDVGGQAFTEYHRAGISKPTERKVERAAAALEKWRAAQIHALEIRQDIYALLESLPVHEADIMVRRYVWLEIWEQIEQETGYTHSNVFKLHRQALRHTQENIDAGYIDEIRDDLDTYIKRRTWPAFTE